MNEIDLPEMDLLVQQATWLQPARAKLLRRVAIARRRRILDLGAGRGVVTGELARRGSGPVTALDRRVAALRTEALLSSATRVGGDARRLPFPDATFDLIFSQLTLLWIRPLAYALDESVRVLRPGGAWVAIEPDYGGMIEYPSESATRPLWQAALRRAGANPDVGRRLPGELAARGLTVRVELLDQLVPPDPARFDLLRGLPLTEDERTRLAHIEAISESKWASSSHPWAEVAHLPFFLIIAEK